MQVRDTLSPLLEDPLRFAGVVPADVVDRLLKQSGQSIEDLMRALLPLAAVYARPPISDFKVGAVARGRSGSLFLGANLEFPLHALNQTVHAEQSAVNNAWLHGEEGILAISVNYPPCGHCRQFLNELPTAGSLRISLPGRPAFGLGELLPEHFGPRDLGIDGRLMHPRAHGLALADAGSDPLVAAALAAANQSYAPYSKDYAGVALATADGTIIGGRHGENAAYNPSLSPLQSALSRLLLSGRSPEAIRRAVLVENRESSVSQETTTRELLRSLSTVPLEAFRTAE